MRIFLVHLLALLLPLCMTTAKNASPAKTEYAYLSTDTAMYYTEGDGALPMVTLPATYFVAILEKTESFYKASYLDIVGYVKAADVEIVDYTPKYKYASDVRFVISNDGQGANLRSAPHVSNNATLLPASVTGIAYGYASGDALIPQVGDRWYYVKADVSGVSVTGYVYTSHISVDPVPKNEIIAEPVDNDPDYEDSLPFSLDKAKEIIFISALSLPAVLIMFLLFRKPPRSKDKTLRHYKED